MAIESDDIKLVLGPVEPQYYFYAKDGTVVKSLVDLARAVELMDETSFKHHVTDSRNDFASWINDIIKDKSLANEVKGLRSKEAVLRKIEERILQLRRLERKLSEIEQGKKQQQHASVIKVPSEQGGIKEYLYGLIIGIIIGVLIGLLV
jgi:hypothetical protein